MADEQQQQEPTEAEKEDMQKVSVAGAEAKMEGKDPAAAMKEKRDEVGLVKLDDETIDQLASKLNELNMDSLRSAGAFDPPPEPVRPPEQPQGPATPGERAEESAAPPRKRSFADRILGS